MGQKVHPFILRIGIVRTWQSRWFVQAKEYPKYILEDYLIRKAINKRLKTSAVGAIIIERLAERIKVRILTARPGMVIGRHGSEIERLREGLNGIAKKELSIEIEEIKAPAQHAQLVSQNIAFQLERRIAFRRAIKRAIDQAMSGPGILGIKVSVAGRLGGAEMSRRETFKKGKIPLQTLRADIDYGFAEAATTYGRIGVKTWVYKGEILVRRKTDATKKLKDKQQDVKNAVNA